MDILPFDQNRLIELPNFKFPRLERERRVMVYLPTDYLSSQKHYRVLYMHDAQNLCDPRLSYGGNTWRITEYLDKYQELGLTDGVILVGIDNGQSERMNEYSPWTKEYTFTFSARSELNDKPQGGLGSEYMDDIVFDLKPFIDSTYRTRPEREYTAIAGSSMGGFISLFGILKHQETFSTAGVFSPAFWFAENSMHKFVTETPINHPINIYMDMGMKETSDAENKAFPQIYLNGSRLILSILAEKDENLDCLYIEDMQAVHNEAAWAKRLPHFLNYWLM